MSGITFAPELTPPTLPPRPSTMPTNPSEQWLAYRPSEESSLQNLPSYVEQKRGDTLNRLAYGCLPLSEISALARSIASQSTPVFYGTAQTCRGSLNDIEQNLSDTFSQTASVSLQAVGALIAQAREQAWSDQTHRLEHALLIDLIFALADEGRHRDSSFMVIPKQDVDKFASGLSPVFDIGDESQELRDFVHILNDREQLSKLPIQYGEEGALCVAISYKHNVGSDAKLSQHHLEELTRSLLRLPEEVGVRKVQFWIDRILSSRKRDTDRSWYEEGLMPFIVLPVIYVMGADNSPERLIDEMDTMWINIERVAASVGRGMVSAGKKFGRKQLSTAGITFENTSLSHFDWWMSTAMDQSNEEKFQALLFAMGNTEMLERQTYFPADKEALLQMAYQAFQSPDKVVRLIPISNYIMRDETIWNTDDEWLGEFEWCVNFREEGGRGKCLLDASAVIERNGFSVWFRKVCIEDEAGVISDLILITRTADAPVVCLVVYVNGNTVSLRSTVVLDSSLEFSQHTLGFVRNVRGGHEGNFMRDVIGEMLRNSTIVAEDEDWISIEPIDWDDEILSRTLGDAHG